MKFLINTTFWFLVCYLAILTVKSQINPEMYFAALYHKIQTINRKIRKQQFLNENIIQNTKLTLEKETEYIQELFQKGKFDEKGYCFLIENIEAINNYMINKQNEQNKIIKYHTK